MKKIDIFDKLELRRIDNLGPIADRTRSKFDLRNKNIKDIKGIINERKKKSLNQHFQKINNKNNLEECISEISNRESDNYRNENDASKANGTTRKVVGGILAGVGTAGAIASAAALIKVGAAGIVSALAELVGAAAAPWVAIAIPVVLVALTVIGTFLFFGKPSGQN